MSWQDQLRPASFRGVPFHALTDSATFGRRTVLHEYPFKDLPYVEDLGRRAREIRITGFVLGEDFMAERDALIEAIEQAGSGKLVHPQYGELTVTVADGGVTVEHSTAEGGCARISFSCIESGEAKFPIATSATQDILKGRADFAQGILAGGFAGLFNLDGLPSFAFDAAFGRINAFVSQVRGLIAPISGMFGRGDVLALIDAFVPQIGTLLQEPLQLAQQVQGIVGAVRTAMPAQSVPTALVPLATFGAGETHLPPITPSRQQETINRDAINELVRGSAGIEHAHAIADMEFADFDTAIAIRDRAVDHLDIVADVTADDAVFDALTGLRAALVRDVAARGADLARLVSFTPQTTAPALVLAHQLYDDASRDADLLTHNRIPHPGFVPGGAALEVPVDA